MTIPTINNPTNFPPQNNQSLEAEDSRLAVDFWDKGKTWSKRALTISTSIGTFIVILYFLRIHYLPIDSISSMASLGGIVAFLACAMLAMFVVLWGAPTAVVLFGQSTSAWVSISHRFWTRKASNDYASSTDAVSVVRVVGFVTLAIGVLWPLFLVIVVPGFIVPKEFQTLAVSLLGFAWFSGLCWFSYESRPPASDLGPLQLDTGWRGILKRGGWFLFFSFSGGYPLLAFAQMSLMSSLDVSGALAEWVWVLSGLVAVVALHSVNLGIELSKSTDSTTIAWKFQIGATVICIFIVLTILGATTKLHDLLMQAISVRISHAHIVVQKSACDALRLAGVSASRYSALPGEVATDSCILLDVTVLSKLGAQWRIACARDAAATNNYRGFNLDAKDVITLVDVQRADKKVAEINDVCMGMWTP
jgi:hypothetical protein